MWPRPIAIRSTNQLAHMQITSQHCIVPALAVTSPAHLSVWLCKDSDRSNREAEGSQPGRGSLSGRNTVTLPTTGSGINTRFRRRLSVQRHSPGRLGPGRPLSKGKTRRVDVVFVAPCTVSRTPLSRTDLFCTDQLSLKTGSGASPLLLLLPSPFFLPRSLLFHLPFFCLLSDPATAAKSPRCPARSSQTAASRGMHWTTKEPCRSPWISSHYSAWTTTRTPCTTTTRSPGKRAST